MTKKEFFRNLEGTFEDCVELSKLKNADYADEDPFKNFRMSVQVGVSPERAILVRLSDKISRISRLLDKEPSVCTERIEDTILDGINYLAILKAYLQQDGK